MELVDDRQRKSGVAAPRFALGGLVALYSATLLLAACLLFSLQPMFTKRVLPLLGGTPAVWSVATVVFQGLLLAGYAYAHALIRWLPQRTGFLLHMLVLTGGFTVLPVAVAAGYEAPPQDGEALWLVGLFLTSVGVPFFALSASAPLLQAWFARSGDARAEDPYFLYRASNAGSFAALLAYPLLIEPFLGLAAQSKLWSFGYGALACAVLACGLSLRGARMSALPVADARGPAPTAARRAAWVALSAVPSALLVAATAHISTDIAAIPLIWVVPLALYLLSFIAAFRPGRAWPERPLAILQIAGTGYALLAFATGSPFLPDLAVTLGLLLVNALIAHRTVYTLRPRAARLTEFYLCTSLGGVLGGIFAALLAPKLFSGLYEYPLLLAAALACRPRLFEGGRRVVVGEAARVLAMLVPAGLVAAIAATVIAGKPLAAVVLCCLLFAYGVNWRKPLRIALLGAATALAAILLQAWVVRDGERHRSFFGVHGIETSTDGRFRLLFHGTTLHGAMRIRDDDGTPTLGRPEPTTYYAPGSPLAEVLEIGRQVGNQVRNEAGDQVGEGGIPNVSVVGLGAGSLACHARPGEAWTFFEIDPVIARIASDPARFRFLSECAPDAAVVQGDARLTLAGRKDAARVLILDAFSSDAIPIHLLTGEALDIELAHLDARGLLAMHISNLHFELRHVLARLAADRGMRLLYRQGDPGESAEQRLRAPSQVALMTRDPSAERAALARGWTTVTPDLSRRPWSDDYADAFEAMRDCWRRPAETP